MNNTTPFIRKIIYIAIIGALLVPLSMISRPAMRGKNGDVKDAGGKLSMLREDYNLSQSKISEIDPASETMKLASLGLRGVAGITFLGREEKQSSRSCDFKKRESAKSLLLSLGIHLGHYWLKCRKRFGQLPICNQVPIDRHSLMDRFKMGRSVDACLSSGRSKNTTKHRADGAFAFGARNVDDGIFPLKVVNGKEAFTNP